MVIVAAVQFDLPKEGVQMKRAVAMPRLQGLGRFIVGKEFPVVVETLNDAAPVAQQRCPQPFLNPRKVASALAAAQPAPELAQEGFRLALLLLPGFFREFFLDSGSV